MIQSELIDWDDPIADPDDPLLRGRVGWFLAGEENPYWGGQYQNLMAPSVTPGALSSGATWRGKELSKGFGCLNFSGTTSYVTVQHNARFALTGDMTLLVSVNVTSFANYRGLIGKTNPSHAAPYDWYLDQTNGRAVFNRGNGSGSAAHQATAAPSLGVWQRVGVTMSGTTVTHYLQGAANGSGTISTTIADAGGTLILGSRNDVFVMMLGQADDFVIVNRAWAAAEFAADYAAWQEVYPSLLRRVRRQVYLAVGGALSATVNQVTETDTAQAVTRLKTKALGQNSEVDTAQALTRVKSRTLGQNTETDTAQAVAWSPKHRLVAQAAETDTAQGVGRLKAKTLGQPAESDTAQMVAWAPKHRLVNQATETDAAQALGRLKAKTLGLNTETDEAQSVTRSGIPAAVNQASEADAAQAVTARKTKALGQCAETDAAQALARLKTRAVGQVSETDTAQGLGRLKTLTVAITTETDAAQALGRLKVCTLGLVSESDAAQAVGRVKAFTVGLVTEADLAQPVTRFGAASGAAYFYRTYVLSRRG